MMTHKVTTKMRTLHSLCLASAAPPPSQVPALVGRGGTRPTPRAVRTAGWIQASHTSLTCVQPVQVHTLYPHLHPQLTPLYSNVEQHGRHEHNDKGDGTQRGGYGSAERPEQQHRRRGRTPLQHCRMTATRQAWARQQTIRGEELRNRNSTSYNHDKPGQVLMRARAA